MAAQPGRSFRAPFFLANMPARRANFGCAHQTGTEDVRAGADSKPHHLPQQLGRETPPNAATTCDEGENERQSQDAQNPLETGAIREDSRDDATGFNKDERARIDEPLRINYPLRV